MDGEKKKDTILVVEDEPGIARLLSERLYALGLEVSTVSSAEEAETFLKNHKPTLMLLDHSLPGKNGLQLIQALKAGAGAVPPFIVTTGRGDEDLAVALMKLGAGDYIIKDGAFLEKIGPAALKAIGEFRLREELERKRSILAGIISASKDPMYTVDRELRCTSFNQAYAEQMLALYGAEVKEGGLVTDLQPEADRAAVRAGLQRALAGETVVSELRRGREEDGSRCFEVKYAPLRAEGGEIIGAAVTERDITERMALENHLRDKAELFSRVLESSGGTLFSVTPDGRYVVFNETHAALMKRWYGVGIEAGKPVLEYLTEPVAAERFKARLARGLAGEEYSEETKDVNPATGKAAYFEVLVSPIKAAGGAVIGVTLAGKDITERRSWEAMLKASEERFRDLFEKAPLGYQSLDEEGHFLEVNQAWLDTLGYHRQEVIGRWFGDFLAPGYKEVFKERFPLFMAMGRIHSEFEMLHKDGGRRFIAFDGRVGRTADGAFKQTHCILKDITEAKLAESRLKISEDKLRTLFECANDAVFVHPLGEDAEAGKFTEVNGVACARLGYTREELLSMGPADVDAEGMTEKRVAALKRLALEGRCVFEMVHRARNGLHIPVEISARRFEFEGRPYVVAMARDISARRQAERENLLLVETIKASLNEIYIFDAASLKFKFLNRGALENTGYSPDEAVSLTPLDLKPDYTPEGLEALLGPLRRGEKKVAVFETRHRRKDGSFYPAEVHLQYEAGHAVFLVVVNDLTTRKRMEAELLNSQKIESLGVLAGGIAHDFNNMLTGIVGNLSLLAEKNPAAADLLADTLSAADSARALTSQLLSFSTGGKPVKKEFCLQKTLREIFHLATRGALVASETEIDDRLWSVDGDEHQLKQVVTNILLNGLQAMPSGGTLRLKAGNRAAGRECAPALKPGNYVEVTISDTGGGIRPEDLPHIFEPYFTTKAKGHGLGLPMAWSVVKSHGGHIEVDSGPGGTEFRLLLPATGRNAPCGLKSEKDIKKGSGRILLLEDEAIVARAAERMLGELGYTFEITAEGSETLRRYAEEQKAGRPFDAVIMDLTIPGGMGGKEAGAALRRLAPKAVIIVSSGYSDEPVMADYKAFGFDAVLPKPYRFEDLAEMLSRLIAKK